MKKKKIKEHKVGWCCEECSGKLESLKDKPECKEDLYYFVCKKCKKDDCDTTCQPTEPECKCDATHHWTCPQHPSAIGVSSSDSNNQTNVTPLKGGEKEDWACGHDLYACCFEEDEKTPLHYVCKKCDEIIFNSTPESWEIEYDKKFHKDLFLASRLLEQPMPHDSVKDFIASLLQEQREDIVDEVEEKLSVIDGIDEMVSLDSVRSRIDELLDSLKK